MNLYSYALLKYYRRHHACSCDVVERQPACLSQNAVSQKSVQKSVQYKTNSAAETICIDVALFTARRPNCRDERTNRSNYVKQLNTTRADLASSRDVRGSRRQFLRGCHLPGPGDRPPQVPAARPCCQ